MELPEPVAATFRQQLPRAFAALVEADQLRDSLAGRGDASPELLVDAFQQLFEAMQRTEVSLAQDRPVQTGNQAGAADVSELGEYALELFERATVAAKDLGLEEVSATLQVFTVSMARWIARHGGQLWKLEPVVDALAQTANRTRDPGGLVMLYRAMGEIMDAAAPAIRQDLEKTNPGRPWRILHLNRAIVATRTHQPDVMEQAFALLTEHLPQDAAQFFREGMEQMDLLNYPPHVREVMDRYYRKWSVDRSLH